MALINGEPNPLNYFKMRRVEFRSPHFKYFIVGKYSIVLTKNINTWVEKNLNNRYYIGQGISLDKNKSIVYNTEIGFEDEIELTYFLLACPHLQTN